MPGPTTARKPVIRKAVKQARQALARAARNQIVRNEMKSLIKAFLTLVKERQVEKASKLLPKVVSAVDMAYKSNLIHKNNAARKKSLLERNLTQLKKNPGVPAAEKPAKAPKAEKAPKAPKAAKKPAAKKEEKKA